jgi:NAD-dependent DNA ligase
MSASAKKVLAALKKDFYPVMTNLTKKQLEEVLEYLGDEYYNKGISLVQDEEYDRLRETLAKKYGTSDVLNTVGAKVEKQKVRLPFFMGSMDKIKPDKNNLEGWSAKYKGAVCISDKLDGISGLVIKKNGARVLYTRGDGSVGQDISHMLPFIQIGDIPGLDEYAVRGELIVSKANYDKVKEGKRGARQMVSGLANQKTLTKERKAEMALIEFVAYEVIVPGDLKPSAQFALLDKKSSFAVAKWSTESDITIDKLSAILTEHKTVSKYEIDGIIIAHDKAYPRVAGRNPEHAFAFKMSFADQAAVTEVLHVIWDASKDGYLKPTVNFEPVNIGGVIIQYATGFNAAFIQSHGIGPGAFIEIIRSGDVIPYIKEVKSAAPGGASMPAAKWHWNETHVDALLDTLAGNADVEKKALVYFANTLDISFCGEGTISRLHDAGIKTIPQLLSVTEEFLVSKVDGFKKASAAKLVGAISEASKKATVTQWAVGSAIFGRGIGTKRVEAAFAVVPKSLEGGADLVEKVMAQGGWSKESAEGFVKGLPEFKAFMEGIGFKPKVATPVKVASAGKLKGQVILFTGFHPKDLETEVVKQGGELADTWGKKVTILVIKDATVANEKTKKALAAGIPVMTADQFRSRL